MRRDRKLHLKRKFLKKLDTFEYRNISSNNRVKLNGYTIQTPKGIFKRPL